jgi:hypothetical protein
MTENTNTTRRFAGIRTGATAAVLALAIVGAGAVGTLVGNASERPSLSSSASRNDNATTTADDLGDSSFADDGTYVATGDETFDSGTDAGYDEGYDSTGSSGANGSYDEDAGTDETSYGDDEYDAATIDGSETGDNGDDGGEQVDDTAELDDDPHQGDKPGEEAAPEESTWDEPAEDDPTPTSSTAPAPKPAPKPAPAPAPKPAPKPTSAPTTVRPTTTATTNAAPRLPARTIERNIAVGQRVDLVTDNSLAAGWSDPDHTADWLCLTFTPERSDWWLDGADCQGKGLWARVNQPGIYVVHIRVREATAQFPGGVGPLSAEEITLRLVAA